LNAPRAETMKYTFIGKLLLIVSRYCRHCSFVGLSQFAPLSYRLFCNIQVRDGKEAESYLDTNAFNSHFNSLVSYLDDIYVNLLNLSSRCSAA
jgi:hypothetical protein